MTEIELTNSRKAKLIVFKILEYAETGGMLPDDCGVAFEAISCCLDNCDDSSGLIEQIQQILNSKQWAAPA